MLRASEQDRDVVVESLGEAYFLWPAFVIVGTGVNLARAVFAKQDIIEHKRGKFERQQHREIEQRRRGDEGADG